MMQIKSKCGCGKGMKIMAGIFMFLFIISNFSSVYAMKPTTQSFAIEMSIDYTQIALEYIKDCYPNKIYNVYNTSTWMPFPETKYYYEQVEIDMIPGSKSPKDTVLVTIRHDTLNVEIGNNQYQRDYDEYCKNLPAYYKKLTPTLRAYLTSKIDTVSSSALAAKEQINVTFLISKEGISSLFSEYNTLVFLNTDTSTNDSLLLGGFVEISSLAHLANNPYIKFIDFNYMIQMNPQLVWSTPYIGAGEVHNGIEGTSYMGTGALVGILDTGVGIALNEEGAIHPAIEQETIVGGYRGLVDRKDFTGSTIRDMIGHGTHIAGIIVGNGYGEVGQPTELTRNIGVAPNAGLVSAKACCVPDTPQNIFNQYKDGFNWMLTGQRPMNVPNPTIWRGGVNVISTSLGQNDTGVFTFDGSSQFSLFADYIVALTLNSF